MKGHILSIVLFILGVLLLLVIGLLGKSWLIGLLFGAIFVLAGLIFFRRGK